MSDAIHVACSCDENYLSDAAVMLHSLFSANAGERFVVHFMYDSRLPAAQMEGLSEICARFGHAFEPRLMGEELKKVFPHMERFGGFNAWYRVLLPSLLPQLPKVLYLDVDLLIVDRIRPLWETPLDGKCVAAVTNPLFDFMVERVRNDLGLPDGEEYFNSGVLLMNLDQMRRVKAMEQVVDFIKENRAPMPWADQEPLNAILWNSRVHLAPRWNAIPSIWELSWKYLPRRWSQEMRVEARDRPAIVHFLGPYKPWHFRNRSPYRAEYFRHLAQTRWKDRPESGRSLRNALLKHLPVRVQWRIEDGTLTPKGLARLALPRASALGGLARDAWRWLTPQRERGVVHLMLEALALSRKDVRFIQVGSNDANHGDPLRDFVIAHRWRGILIEPVPYVFERLVRNCRGRDYLTLENVAIGPKDGTADFYSVAKTDEPLPEWYDQLGSFSLDNILKHEEWIPRLRERVVTLKVPSLTFESLCRKHGIGTLDLIHIDAEGYDYEVIKLIDFDAHRPTLLLFEHKHLAAADLRDCHDHLARHGYEWLAEGADTLAVRRDALSPLGRLGRTWRLLKRAQGRRAAA